MWTRVGRNERVIWACTACQVQINLNLLLKHPYLNENSLCTDQMQLPELGIHSLQHILAQPVFDHLRSILCCFIYFQVLLFWLLLYIIYQTKSNKNRALKLRVSSCKSDKAFHLESGQL